MCIILQTSPLFLILLNIPIHTENGHFFLTVSQALSRNGVSLFTLYLVYVCASNLVLRIMSHHNRSKHA